MEDRLEEGREGEKDGGWGLGRKVSRRTDREGGERSVEGGREDGMAGSVVQSLGWERKIVVVRNEIQQIYSHLRNRERGTKKMKANVIKSEKIFEFRLHVCIWCDPVRTIRRKTE